MSGYVLDAQACHFTGQRHRTVLFSGGSGFKPRANIAVSAGYFFACAINILRELLRQFSFFTLRQPLVSLQTTAGLRVKLLLQKRHDLPHSYALDPLRCKQHSLLRAEIRYAIFLQWSHKPTADAVKQQ